MEKHGLVDDTFIPTQKKLYRERTIVAADVVELEKSENCRHVNI